MPADDLGDTSTPKPVTPIAHYQCPKLKSTNYTVWAIQLKVVLEAHGLWEAIEPKENTQVDEKKDKAMTAFLYQALTEDVILQVADDTLDAFTGKLNGYATKAKELGKTLDESLLVRKLLDSTPDRFIQIVASIEKTNDLDNITLDEIVGKLKAFEERIKLRKKGQVESQENLLFAHGEHSRKGRRFSKRGGTSTTQEQSNLILEDDEPSLLMTTYETEHKEVLLNEGQIQPGKYATADASIWYLDNGASNHMTGTKSHFRDIDKSVTGHVPFEDGSYVQIKGRGSILLGCKNNEQKIVSDIYYIPNLKSNILSLGQLTEIGCKIIMDGNKLTLYDKNKKLLIKAKAVKHAIYILNRVPTRALVDKTPYEALYNRKPNLENLRIFGCTAYAKITIPHLKKLDDRSIPMICLGVEEGSKACRLYDSKGKRKHVSKDVRFMETKPWDWDNNGKETSTQDTFWASFVVEGVDNENLTPVNTKINDNTYQEYEPITDPDSLITPPAYTYNPNSKEEEKATISSLMNLEY
nr:zinc finger, CCHC-type [Tanacetum cinerariifolium]